MPRVPQAERQIATHALPGVRLGAQTSARTFGGALGEAAFQLGLEEKQKADQVAVLDADRELIEHETTTLHDPQKGALNRRGRDAFGLPEEVLGGFDAKAAEIEKRLTNDQQRYSFRRSAIARRLDLDRTVQRHVAGQIKAFDDQTTESYIANETDSAIASGDPERISLGLDRTRAALVDHQRRNGLPDVWLNQKIAAVSTKVHGGTIERLLANGQDVAAKAYYDAHKDEINGAALPQIEKAIEVGSTRGESQRQADAILLKHRDLGAAIAAARKIDNPTVRDATETRVKDYFATARAAEEERRTQAFRRAARALEQGGGVMERVSPGDIALLADDPGKLHALETRSRQVREGVEPVTDYQRYYDLMGLASEDATRSKFLRTDLMEHRHELSNRHFEELTRLQSTLRSGKAEDETLDGYRTKKQVVDDALASVKIDPTPKPGTKNAEKVNVFRRRVDEEVLALQRQTGKKATSKDVQEIVDRLMIQGKVPGSGYIFDDTKRLYELKPGEGFAVDADEIPIAEREKIEQALKRNGRPVTPATIVELFRLKHLKRAPAAVPAPAPAEGQ